MCLIVPSQQYEECEDYEEVRVSVPWGYITGKWWGPTNVQPIIAVHGWQDNAGTFDNLAPTLRDRGLSVYCIDLPGHGFSSHLPKGQNYSLFWDGVYFLRRIVKHFDWKQISIIGHSLGGGIGFLYCASFPDDVKKFVSLDVVSPYIKSAANLSGLVGPSIDKFLEYEKKYTSENPAVYSYEEIIDFIIDAHKGSVTKESAEVLLRRGMKPAKNSEGFIFLRDPRLKMSALSFMFPYDQAKEFASKIICEVCNIKCTISIQLDEPDSYEIVLDHIEKQAKKVERHTVEGTHHVHLNEAHKVASIIYYFLTS